MLRVKEIRFSTMNSIRQMRRLIEEIAPDLVHLNSSTLAPAALGCARVGVPIVWHIREPLARGYLGIRRGLIRRFTRCVFPDRSRRAWHTGSPAQVVSEFPSVSIDRICRSSSGRGLSHYHGSCRTRRIHSLPGLILVPRAAPPG